MSDSPATPSPRPCFIASWRMSLVLALGALALKGFGAEVGYLTIHGARDWERGYRLLHGLGGFWHGPEKSDGTVIPGFFFNLLTGLFQLGGRGIWPAAAGPAILFAASVLLLHDALRRALKPWPALAGAALYATFPLGTLAMRYLWNPSYLFLFLVLAVYGVSRAVHERRGNFLALSLASALLATQLHATAWFLVGGIALAAAGARLCPTWKWLAVVVALHAAFIVPHYVAESARDWPTANNFTPHPPDEPPLNARLSAAPAPNLFWCLGRQVFTPNPASRENAPWTFSYDEWRLQDGTPVFKGLAWAASALSLPLGLLCLWGWIAALKAGGPRRALALHAIGIAVPLVAFFWLWAPDGGTGARANLHLRYFFVLWPLQFIGVALALEDLAARRPAWWRWIGAWAAVATLVFALHGLRFMQEARRDGRPFQYLHYTGVVVFSLRDQMDVARFLVEEHGVTEATMRTHVHSPATMWFVAEQSLTYPMRAALDSAGEVAPFDAGTYFYVTRSEWEPFLEGDFEELDRRVFGSLAVVVFRPGAPLPEGWVPDYPVDVYFDR